MAVVELDHERVMERLDRVDDPELDRSIVELEYIKRLDIDDAVVRIDLMLPTAWCSPAFAWMMAVGAREEVSDLPGVEQCEVWLTDHMHTEEINRGVNEGLRFEDVFEDADGGIEAVQRTLDEKARMARQYEAVGALTDAGVRPEQVVTLQRADVSFEDGRAFVSLAEEAFVVSLPAESLVGYLEKAEATGLVADPDDLLFATPDDDPIPLEDFEMVQHRARLAKTNIDGQGGVCAALHESRNGVPAEQAD